MFYQKNESLITVEKKKYLSFSLPKHRDHKPLASGDRLGKSIIWTTKD